MLKSSIYLLMQFSLLKKILKIELAPDNTLAKLLLYQLTDLGFDYYYYTQAYWNMMVIVSRNCLKMIYLLF